MKKSLIIGLFLWSFTSLKSFSQIPKNMAYMLVKYNEIAVSDSTDLQKKKYDVMGLEIGNSISRFYSITLTETQKALEEQIKNTASIDLSKLSIPKNRRGKDRVIFKNLETNTITTDDNLGVFEYSYQEPIPTFNWQIQPDTLRILSYLCQKAICQYKGRTYQVWFTPEINVSEGPWKFTGLPGLILKVTESKGHYSFDCTSIEKLSLAIAAPNNKAQKVTKQEFLSFNKLFLDDPLPFLNNGKSSFTPESTPTNLPKRHYNPMELTDK